MKMLKKQSFLFLVITMLSVVKTFAQIDPDGEGAPLPPQSPINEYTLPLMVVAIFLGAYIFYVSNKKNLIVK